MLDIPLKNWSRVPSSATNASLTAEKGAFHLMLMTWPASITKFFSAGSVALGYVKPKFAPVTRLPHMHRTMKDRNSIAKANLDTTSKTGSGREEGKLEDYNRGEGQINYGRAEMRFSFRYIQT